MPRRHHPVVRITHWVNALALTIMVGSGLRIFNAYPAFARKGETFCCYPFEDHAIPEWLTFGGWLGGARHWHFAMMWVLVANGLVYLGFIYLHGEWRDLVPRRGDLRDAWEMMKFYSLLAPRPSRQGKHNALQKIAYFALPMLGDRLGAVTGLAIWKPVQLAPLTDAAGRLRVGALLALPGDARARGRSPSATSSWCSRSIRTRCASIITGRLQRVESPEARNARPFYQPAAARDAAAHAEPHRATDFPRTRGAAGSIVAPSSRRRLVEAGALSSRRATRWARASAPLLTLAERWNERVERTLFRHRAMDRAATPARRPPALRFPSYFISDDVPIWDERCAASGARGHRACSARCALTLDELPALPRIGRSA